MLTFVASVRCVMRVPKGRGKHPPDRPIADPKRERAILARMDAVKRRHRQTGNPIHLMHLKLLGTAFSRTAKGGTVKSWALDGLRRKVR